MNYTCALSATLLALAALQMPLAAQTFQEPDDATDNVLEPAPTPPGPLAQIVGSIRSAPEADAYAIRIADPSAFEATTDGNESDTQLWLFDAEGQLIDWSDDISQSNLASRLTGANLTGPGLYVLAITEYCYEPVDSEGDALISTLTPWAGWSTGGNVGMCDGGGSKAAPRIKVGSVLDLDYTISLTSVNGSSPQPTVLPADSLALVALYNATNGSGWLSQTNWLTADVGSWFGIQVEDSRVTSIQLGGNELTGSVPGELGDLTGLRHLEIHQNPISGPFPVRLTQLANLDRLWFDETAVCVPAESEFQEWLAGIDDVRGTDVPCAPAISASPSALDFGAVSVGETSALTFAVSNTGTAAAEVTVSGAGTFGADGFTFVSGDGSFTLEPAAEHDIVVRFAPVSAGEHTSAISVIYEGGGLTGDFFYPLSGTGSAPAIGIAPPELSFGEVTIGVTRELTVSVSNQGDAVLAGTVAPGEGFLEAGFSLKSGDGDFALEPDSSFVITVAYRPVAAGGVTVAVVITHNDPLEPDPIAVSVTGAGVLPPAPFISLDPPTLDFGDVEVGASKDRTLSVSNLGPGLLQGSVAAGSGWQAAGFSLLQGGGAFALSSGESRSIVVRMSPGSVGEKASSLNVTHTAGNEPSPIRVAVQGSAVPAEAEISVAPMLLEWGSVTIGASAERSLIVRHVGSSGRLAGSVEEGGDLISKGFATLSGAGTFDLGPGDQAEVRVSFTPDRVGLAVSEIRISHNAPAQGSVVVVPIAGEGIDPVNPAMDAVPSGLTFGDVAVGSSVALSVTFKNVGSGLLEGEVLDPTPPAGFTIGAGGGTVTLSPGELHVVTVRYSPSAAGVSASNLQLVSNAGTGTVVIPLIGNGVSQNTAPIAVADTVETQAEYPVVVFVLDNDVDPNGDEVRLVGLVASPRQGIAAPTEDGTILYTPFSGFADGYDRFQYRITDGTYTGIGTVVVRMAASVATAVEPVAAGFELRPNYPNPFRHTTRIRYALAQVSWTTLRVYDSVGRLVDTMVDRVQSPGAYEVIFAADALPSGTYFAVLEQDGIRRVRGLNLTK